MARQASLIGPERQPDGFLYREDFITPGEELDLLARIGSLDFHDMKMRGVIARRRVIHYGVKYSFETFKASEGPPIPRFLLPLRERAADGGDGGNGFTRRNGGNEAPTEEQFLFL